MATRVGMFGGTFDPVHNGHLAVARALVRLFGMQKLIFMPAFKAPHKRNGNVSAAWHRYAMLTLATRNDPKLLLSTLELDAPQQPFTIETIPRINAQLAADARLFVVLGADSWEEIRTWRDWEQMLQLSDFIVVMRPGYKMSNVHVTDAVRARAVDLRGLNEAEVAARIAAFHEPRIYFSDAVKLDISSTDVRELAASSQDLRTTVPAVVADYIDKYRLYIGKA